MLKCWKDIPGCHQFVRDKWTALQIDGWGGFVLKEKFKLISRIDSLKARFSALEGKGEDEDLSEAELEELHRISSDIHSL
ncbi:cysteine-rich receptor-like protein kinase, partial [Trifolium medium]|nr:cysteine-rich receptor-like protein kinase [Trifolium medium]